MGWLGRLTARMKGTEGWDAERHRRAMARLTAQYRRKNRATIRSSLAACVALWGLRHDSDVPDIVRLDYPHATDEEIAAHAARVGRLERRAIELCARHDRSAPRPDQSEVVAALRAEFPDYPAAVLNRAAGNGYYADWHG